MSGNTIGGVIGGAIGFVIGGPAGAQWGWMIGSVVGGIVDPQTIQGAQWQNQQLQGSADGLARAVIFGTATVTGNLLDAEPGGPRIGKKSEGGKGGPQVERDTALLTYAVEICDSSELRGTTVLGVIAVWEDEKLVYDLRPDESGAIPSDQQVASAKWAKNKKFYFGGEDQEPPPELEAIHGIGNVPAYRGTCLMTALDEDLMVDVDDKPRGRISTYKFLVSVCQPVLTGKPAFIFGGQSVGDNKAVVRTLTDSGAWLGDENYYIGTGNSTYPKPAVRLFDRFYTFVGSSSRSCSIFDFSAWTEGPSIPTTNFLMSCHVYLGRIWVTAREDGLFYLIPGDTSFTAIDTFDGRAVNGFIGFSNYAFVTTEIGYIYRSTSSGDSFDVIANVFGTERFYLSCAIATNAASDDSITGSVRIAVGGRNDSGAAIKYSDDLGITWSYSTIESYNSNYVAQLKYIGNQTWMAALTPSGEEIGSYFLISYDNCATFQEIALSEQIYAWAIDGTGAIAHDKYSEVVVIAGKDSYGDAKAYISGNLSDWDLLPIPVPDIENFRVWEVAPSTPTGTPIPDVPGYYVDADGNIIGPDLPVGTACSAPLDQVVRRLYKLGAPQLVDAEFDLSALESDIVRGHVVQDANVTVAEACEPLRKVYNFDLPAYDGQVHAIKRGRATDWTLNEDDLVAMDSEYEESMQDDSVSYPKKLHLGYIDASLDYKMTTQISERYSADVRVVGEEKTDMQMVLSATEAKQAAVKLHKIMWANIEETRKLTIPMEYIEAVNSDTFSFRGRRYRIDQMRVEGLNVVLESAAYDRINNYQSNAVGVEGQGAPDLRGSVRGPTISVIMNLPVLRPEDDKPGVYWASTGVLSGWDGARLLVSRYGANYVDTGVVSGQKSVIARLTEAVPIASRYGIDRTTTIRIKMVNSFGAISGTTFDGLLRRDRAAALVKPDGTAEIIQFLTATEVAPREYEIGGLLRGRLNTAPSAHDAGAYFVMLDDSLRFVELGVDDATAPLTFKAVTLYTNAEDNIETDDYTGEFESVREWAPVCVRYEYDGTSLNVTWAGRGRIGSSRVPYNSSNFKQQYRVTVLSGSGGIEIETGNQSYSFAGLSSWDSISVVALSRIANTYNSEEGTE